MPDFKKPFIIHVDASDLGEVAVLKQDVHKLEHPTCYFSKKFNSAQRNYSTSVILAPKQFEFYITPALFPIDIFTDHNPIVFLNRAKNRNQQLLRWSLMPEEYTLNIHHIPGKQNVMADVLSRGL